ncbi:MAG: tRNA1(Val) (adenine(37)-N6)-methyltransferase [Flavisolibacter sp.]
MPNPYFQFKQFTVFHDKSAMKITTDACFFGAWCAEEISKISAGKTNLLDIGAGTGLLSLMITQKNKLHVDAVEIDSDAANQARENIATSPWSQQVSVYNENILQLDVKKKYDFIVSNPPFYENELNSDRQAKNIAHHSEELKLNEVFDIINQRLNEDGIYFLLLPFKRELEIKSIAAKNKMHINKKLFLQPSIHHKPTRIVIMGSKSTKKQLIQTISIRDEKDDYSEEFRRMLKDYYLRLPD